MEQGTLPKTTAAKMVLYVNSKGGHLRDCWVMDAHRTRGFSWNALGEKRFPIWKSREYYYVDYGIWQHKKRSIKSELKWKMIGKTCFMYKTGINARNQKKNSSGLQIDQTTHQRIAPMLLLCRSTYHAMPQPAGLNCNILCSCQHVLFNAHNC